MFITRINQFEARPGSEEALYAFLQSIISIIVTCPGAVSCRLLRSTDDPASFAIIEEWDSIEAHQMAARAVPREKMAEAAALFAKSPSGAYYKS
jgi:quinol monooxygenase YgiN